MSLFDNYGLGLGLQSQPKTSPYVGEAFKLLAEKKREQAAKDKLDQQQEFALHRKMLDSYKGFHPRLNPYVQQNNEEFAKEVAIAKQENPHGYTGSPRYQAAEEKYFLTNAGLGVSNANLMNYAKNYDETKHYLNPDYNEITPALTDQGKFDEIYKKNQLLGDIFSPRYDVRNKDIIPTMAKVKMDRSDIKTGFDPSTNEDIYNVVDQFNPSTVQSNLRAIGTARQKQLELQNDPEYQDANGKFSIDKFVEANQPPYADQHIVESGKRRVNQVQMANLKNQQIIDRKTATATNGFVLPLAPQFPTDDKGNKEYFLASPSFSKEIGIPEGQKYYVAKTEIPVGMEGRHPQRTAIKEVLKTENGQFYMKKAGVGATNTSKAEWIPVNGLWWSQAIAPYAKDSKGTKAQDYLKWLQDQYEEKSGKPFREEDITPETFEKLGINTGAPSAPASTNTLFFLKKK